MLWPLCICVSKSLKIKEKTYSTLSELQDMPTVYSGYQHIISIVINFIKPVKIQTEDLL